MRPDIYIDDTGYYRGLIRGDRVEFVTAETGGLWAYATVAYDHSDGFYTLAVLPEGDEREVFRLLKASGRFVICGTPDEGWTVDVDGSAITNAFPVA